MNWFDKQLEDARKELEKKYLTKEEIKLLAKFFYGVGWIGYDDIEFTKLVNKIMEIADER